MKKPACGKSNIRESCPVGHLMDVTFPCFSCFSDDSFIDLLKLAFHLCDPELCILQGFLKAPFYSLYSSLHHTSLCQHVGMFRHSVVSNSLPPLHDCSPPGSSVHGILQAWILEWVAISFSRESFWLRDWTQISCIAGGILQTELWGKPYWVSLIQVR